MKIVVSAGGRFHAHRLAQQLLQRDALQQLYTFDHNPTDRSSLPAAYVSVHEPCKIADKLFVRLHLGRVWNKTHFNRLKDNVFDAYVSKELTKQRAPDIFVGWANYAEKSLFVARQRGTKLIIIESGSCHISVQEALIKQEYDRWGLRTPPICEKTKSKMLREYEAADYIMTPSPFVQNSFLETGFPSEKILCVPYGADTSFFTPAPNPPEVFTALFVGLISLQKGIPYLLEAWRRAALPTNQARLVLVGNMQQDFLAIRTRLPITSNVHFRGGVRPEVLKTYYQQASIFVMPSIQEGLTMAVGEAIASGLPVIASTHTGWEGRIIPGVSGSLYNPYDVDHLADLLRWHFLHYEKAQQLAATARQQLGAHTWDAYGQQVYGAYQRIMNHE
ncbi:glycosyltransferase family 1 protein [bacterium]|nr:glycosyltransferase family 1 protein [bacterium]